MLTINDYIRHQIRTQSNKIHAIKQLAAKQVLQTFTLKCYIDPKTNKPYVLTKPLTDLEIDEKKLVYDDYVEETHDHIKPSSPQWKEYVQLKQDVSLWLGTLHVSKGQEDKAKYHTKDLDAAKKRFERTTKMLNKYKSVERKCMWQCAYLENVEKEIEHEKALRASA